MNDEKFVNSLVRAHGSPLNILMPAIAEENLSGFEETLKKHKLKHRVYYAHKANKSSAVVKQLSNTSAFIDVASAAELSSALANGFTGDRIEATGPKNKEFILLCLQHGVVINVDDLSELELIQQLSSQLRKREERIKVLIRIGEFNHTHSNIIQKDSRFGLKIKDILPALQLLKDNEQTLELLGFSFHLATISTKERVYAVENCIGYVNDSIKMGLNPRVINIGGGFSFSFLKSSQQWETYISYLKESIVKADKELMTWNNSGLGFRSEKGTLKGAPAFSDFYVSQTPFLELENVLEFISPKFGVKIADLLVESGLEIYVEPGRSMLNQVGITATKVTSIKTTPKGENLILVDMNRSNLNSQDLEYFADPILLKEEESKVESEEAFSCFIAGNLCLPHDFLARRKFFLKTKPQVGDVLIFVNTAGYFMDFAESSPIMHPTAQKIALRKTDDGYEWFDDSKYTFLK